jgi:hypothetical protein
MISPPLTITPEIYRKNLLNSQVNLSIHSNDSHTIVLDNNTIHLNYVVLCRVNTGLSSLHSVQIGSYDHIPLRLENNDLDIGVKLLSVKLCGDCLIVSGSNGFVGSGRISQFNYSDGGGGGGGGHPVGGGTASSSASLSGPSFETKRIYIRRFLNNFHGEDSVIQCLATPRYHIHTDNTTATGPFNYVETSVSILASGDDIGGLCIWRRDKGATGPTYSVPNKTGGGGVSATGGAGGGGGAGQHSTVRYGYTWTCIHHAKVGHRISSLSFSNDGNYLAVTTLERAILFDLTALLSSDSSPPPLPINTSMSNPLPLNARGQVAPYPLSSHYIPSRDIRTFVLDDCVGHSAEVLFSVDLSSNGFIKIWKLKQGTMTTSPPHDTCGGGPCVEDGGIPSNPDRLGISPDHLSYTELPLSQFISKHETYLPLHKLFIQKDPMMEKGAAVTAPVPSPAPTAVTPTGPSTTDLSTFDPTLQSSSQRSREGSNVSEPLIGSLESSDDKLLSQASAPPPPPSQILTSQNLLITSKSFLHKQKETGWMIDPFCYADVCVIDPLRMHLRDWWCDYSSRFLLLGHSRISSLTNFEPISLSSHSSTLSKNNPLRDSGSSPLSTSSLTGAGSGSVGASGAVGSSVTGLDRKSTSMFWSTLTSSLGRRVIARYYIPLLYYEKKKQNLDLKADCLKFILYVSRCLYETLGEEYLNSLLVGWKALIQDEVRNILEKYSSSWFKDLTIIHLDILRRFELSPNLALNCLDELIQVIGRAASAATVTSATATGDEGFLSSSSSTSYGGGASNTMPTPPPLDNSPPLIELQNVMNMLITLRNSLLHHNTEVPLKRIDGRMLSLG